MFTVDLDARALLELTSDVEGAVERLRTEAQALAVATHAHVVEQAQQRLRSRREMFLEGLSWEQVDEDNWVVRVDGRVRWIDDGMPPHSMLPRLLASKKAKVAADGSRYLTVPFQHNRGGPASQTTTQQLLAQAAKRELKRAGIPWGKIERHPGGEPKLGLLHRFDVTDRPLKRGDGPGQGHGPVGQVRQGRTGIPFLQGGRVYQRQNAQGRVERHVMTFRTASSKQVGTGAWEHPGLEGMGFLEEARQWASRQWEELILPRLMAQLADKK